MRGDAARELFVQLVLENKESLFSKNSTLEIKRKAWERIRAQCGALGVVQFSAKSPKELSSKFSDMKRRTLEKKKACETLGGSARVTFTTVDNHVLDIIEYNNGPEGQINESITTSSTRKRSLEHMRGSEPTSDGKLNNCIFDLNGLCSSVNIVPDSENRPSHFTPVMSSKSSSDLDTQLKKAKLDYFRMQAAASEEQIYYYRAKGQEAEVRKKLLELEYEERIQKRLQNEETTEHNSFDALK